MIVINLLASMFLGLGLLFYTYVFPKKKVNLLYLLIIISLLPLISLFRKGTYESGDLSYHAAAIFSMYNSFIDGNIIPRWGAELYFEYGSPYHIIMYFLSRMIVVFFHLFGIPMLESLKLFLGLSFVLSGITMYYFVKEEFNEKAGFIAGLFYLFAPYHLVDMHFRVEPGEMGAFVLLPVTLLFTKRLSKKPSFNWIILTALSLTFLILSHQAIALVFFPFLVLYAIYNLTRHKTKKKKIFIAYFASWIIGILLSAFYTITIVFEGGKYTWVYYIFREQQHIFFRQFSEFFYSPWLGGFLFQGPRGELSFILGYFHWAVLGFSLWLLFQKKLKKNDKQLLLLILISFVILFLMMQEFSKPLWETIPLIKYSQNTFRFLMLLSLFTSIIAGIISQHIKNSYVFVIICILVIISSALNWGNRRVIPTINSDAYFEQSAQSFQSLNNKHDYDLPIWANSKKLELSKPPLAHAQILTGIGSLREVFRNTTHHEYVVFAENNVKVRENTLYFPGWKVFLDKKPIAISYTENEMPGVIILNIPKGLHILDVKFENTPVRNTADAISITTIALITIVFLIRLFRHKA